MATERGDAPNPAEVWQQWYDAATAAWTQATRGNAGAYTTPVNIYREWMKGFEAARDQSSGAAEQATPRPQSFWGQWFETTARTWENMSEMGADALGMTTQWTEMMEEARAKMLAGEGVPLDPLTFFVRTYNATSEMWSKAAGDLIGTEAFVEAMSRFLESYTSYAKTFRQVSQEYFSALQLATRPDIARVASLVVAVEDKVDQLEDEFERFSDENGRLIRGTLARSDALAAIERRIAELKSALDDRTQLAQRLAQREQQVERMESTIGQMNTTLQRLAAAVEKSAAARAADSKEGQAEERKATTKRAGPGSPGPEQA